MPEVLRVLEAEDLTEHEPNKLGHDPAVFGETP